MARPHKDGAYINYYIDRELVEKLRNYADDKGQTVAMALKHASLINFFEKEERKEKHAKTA